MKLLVLPSFGFNAVENRDEHHPFIGSVEIILGATELPIYWVVVRCGELLFSVVYQFLVQRVRFIRTRYISNWNKPTSCFEKPE